MRKLIFIILFLLIFISHSKAENLANYTASEIVKWCNGDEVRFTTENIAPEGFTRCGQMEVAALCSPLGNKFFGKGSAPHAYKDCSLGKRIQVSANSLPLDKNDSFDMAALDQEASSKYKSKIKNNLRKSLDNYNFDYDQYLKSLDSMIDEQGDEDADAEDEFDRKLGSSKQDLSELVGKIDIKKLMQVFEAVGGEL